MFRLCVLMSAVLFLPSLRGLTAEAPSAEQVKNSLKKATEYLRSISTEGGYLWRYSENLQERRGEEVATPTQIWIQPPGTPSVGMAFLDAYTATKEDRYLAAAQAAAQALVRGQLESGGWAYLIEFDPKARSKWAYRAEVGEGGNDLLQRKNVTTFDDDNTQSALRFLIAFLQTATNRPPVELKDIRAALDYGLTKMLEAQYPNGAWPQRYDSKPHDPKQHPVRPASIPKNWPRTWPKATTAASTR